jgi:hypothetical protein
MTIPMHVGTTFDAPVVYDNFAPPYILDLLFRPLNAEGDRNAGKVSAG